MKLIGGLALAVQLRLVEICKVPSKVWALHCVVTQAWHHTWRDTEVPKLLTGSFVVTLSPIVLTDDRVHYALHTKGLLEPCRGCIQLQHSRRSFGRGIMAFLDLILPLLEKLDLRTALYGIGSAWLIHRILLIIYRVYFHPLRHVPGPFLAKCTILYRTYYDVLNSQSFRVRTTANKN